MKQAHGMWLSQVWVGTALSCALAASALAAPRFELADGNLVDNSTGLVWQSLAATAGTVLPATPQLGEWRVATANEILGLIPMTGGVAQSIATGSDIYQALTFFGKTAPASANCDAGMACFGAWAVDWPYTGSPTTYDFVSASYSTEPDQSGLIDFKTVATLGTYTASFCPSGLCTAGQFTVRAVPEVQTIALMAWGLLAVGLMRRVWRG